MTEPAGVILAGGLATRMGGGDKGLLPLGGRRLIDHVVARLAPQCAGLALNANGDPARCADLGLPVLADGVAGHPGPLAGVLAGLDWAAGQGAEAIDQTLRILPFGAALGWVFRLPFAGRILDRFYRWFARNRYRLGCGEHCQYRPLNVSYGEEAETPVTDMEPVDAATDARAR